MKLASVHVGKSWRYGGFAVLYRHCRGLNWQTTQTISDHPHTFSCVGAYRRDLDGGLRWSPSHNPQKDLFASTSENTNQESIENLTHPPLQRLGLPVATTAVRHFAPLVAFVVPQTLPAGRIGGVTVHCFFGEFEALSPALLWGV